MDPERIERILEEANDLLAAGKPDESLRCLERLPADLEDSEDRLEVGTLRAWALSEVGRTDDALDALAPLLDEFPDSARVHGTRGVVLSNAEELDAARDELEQAVTLDPDDEVALANLALVCEKMRDFRRAADLYDRALQLGADIDWALQRKASIEAELGRTDAAKRTLKRYLSLVPEDHAQWVTLGNLHADDDEYGPAFECYRRAEQLAPESASLRMNWGVSAVHGGEVEEARRQLVELTRLTPGSSQVLLLTALLREEEGHPADARRLYEQALELVDDEDEGDLAYVYELAMDFYARQRKPERCAQLLDAAYARNVCTVELCQPYRELTGPKTRGVTWFSTMIECDWDGETPSGAPAGSRPARCLRNFQVVARDPDEAAALALTLAQRLGEQHCVFREFAGRESLGEDHLGLYEVGSEAIVLEEQS